MEQTLYLNYHPFVFLLSSFFFLKQERSQQHQQRFLLQGRGGSSQPPANGGGGGGGGGGEDGLGPLPESWGNCRFITCTCMMEIRYLVNSFGSFD